MRTEYKIGTFKDFTGAERHYVMAAVSIEFNNKSKILSVGVSVCRPADKFDEELGKRIAQGKAEKGYKHTLTTCSPGMINDKVVKALLEQESEFFENNPGYYLAGYDADIKKYKEKLAKNGLTSEEQKIVKYFDTASDERIQLLQNACLGNKK